MVSKTNLVDFSDDFNFGADTEFDELDFSPSPSTSKKPLSASKAQAGLGVVQSGFDIINAGYKLDATLNDIARKTMLANFQANEIESIGKENSLKAETKGFAKGKRSLLSAVAQGQSVHGGIAQSTQRGEETIGLINAMAIEDNAIRQAFGLRQQVSFLELEADMAEIQRDREVTQGIAKMGISTLGFL